jgi:glycine cleavage system aminomethyltransferase T
MTPQLYRQLLDEHGFSHAIPTAQQMGLARAIYEAGRAAATEPLLDALKRARLTMAGAASRSKDFDMEYDLLDSAIKRAGG